jgi:UDP-N-acetylglucosamine--N-acetylmuramyl-(pentapeptide) pyrophosphoryl-undecaprenol N-acetylglucosamine transferase
MPILAVAAALKQHLPTVHIVYVGQRGDRFADIAANDSHIDTVYYVRAGKLRRFHGEGFKQLLHISDVVKNIRDGIYVVIGIYQSWWLMKRLKPAIVFSRGGFVSVPVATGARLGHVPYITHDSDLVPSLANRLIASGARLHAVAFDAQMYPYPIKNTVTTGVPVSTAFQPVNDKMKNQYRRMLNIPSNSPLLFIIGGGQGSRDVNEAVATILPVLFKEFPNLYVVQVAGQDNKDALIERYHQLLPTAVAKQVMVYGFIKDVYVYSGAADVVVTRAGATNLAEFAIQGKACIVLPSSFLAGGHQLKNAAYLAEKKAAIIILPEELKQQPNILADHINELLKNPSEREVFETALAKLAQPDAAERLAKLILEQT